MAADDKNEPKRSDRFATILEHAPVMIDEFDAAGRCILWNRACEEHLGYTQQEVNAAEYPLSLFYPDEEERGRVLKSIQRADGQFREYRVRAKDGHTRYQLWADLRLPDGSQISVGHDVTAQREVEEQLRQSQKLEALGQFAAGIAHDFNNLLTVVLANADLIRGTPGLSADVTLSVDEIVSSTERGAALIRKLLAFTRRGVLTFSSISLSGALHDMATTVTSLVPDSIRVRVNTEPSLPKVRADPVAVDQVLLNLVTNARDAMPQGGTLTLALEERWLDDAEATRYALEAGAYAALSVQDDGAGIDPDVVNRIFDPFFTTKSEHGTGLGLPTVRGLMLQHSGTALVESAPDEGTTVTLLFPISRGARAQPPPASGAASKKILVVDDEASIRELTCLALRRAGYEAVGAPDGEKALAYLQRASPVDLVLTDLVMPNMGGADLFRAARQLSAVPAFLFVTAYAPDDVRTLLHGLDSPHIVRKPYRMGELVEAVSNRFIEVNAADA